MRRFIFRCLSLTIIISVASCARMQPIKDVYNPPTLSNSTKLYFDMPRNVRVSLFSDENCTLGKYGTRVDFDLYTGVSEVDDYRPRFSPGGMMQNIDLEPNIPQVVNFTHEAKIINLYNSAGTLAVCRITYQFTPQDNHNYVAIFEFKNDNCQAVIVDATQSHVERKFVTASGLRSTAKNCDIYEFYSQYRSR